MPFRASLASSPSGGAGVALNSAIPAQRKKSSALRELVVDGPRTNLSQLTAVLADPSFAAA